MKSISSAKLGTNFDKILDSAQKERIVITREGKPSALIVGLESYDAEDILLASSPEFWRMIEERRKKGGVGISMVEVKNRLNKRVRAEQGASKTDRQRRKKTSKR